jgi:hypothetical protein
MSVELQYLQAWIGRPLAVAIKHVLQRYNDALPVSVWFADNICIAWLPTYYSEVR